MSPWLSATLVFNLDPFQVLTEDDLSDSESDADDSPLIDHFDFNMAVPHIPNLEVLHLTYGVKNCGMNFEWNLFEFTHKDCRSVW